MVRCTVRKRQFPMHRSLYFSLLWCLLLPVTTYCQATVTIAGVVSDQETGLPLANASIRLARQSGGILSDDQGKFRWQLHTFSATDTLVVSYVGYRTKHLPLAAVQDKLDVQIGLARDITMLNEVIVFSKFWRKEYTPKELQEDYKKFYTLMEKMHTGLFDYISEQQWQALKDSSWQLCQQPMTHSEFYRLIAWHVGNVRNMHTRHGVTDWWYKTKQHIFPFNVQYFGDRLYVKESLVPDLSFPRGTEIMRINGRTPEQIRSMVWPFIPADGFSDTGRMAALNDYFPWFFSLFVEECDTYTIMLKTLSGETSTVTTQGLQDSFRHLSLQQVYRWKKSALELQINDTLKTAYFRIEDSHVFKDSIQVYFKRIRDAHVQYLIIDLRGNQGIREEEQVAELMSYLVTEPFRVYERIEIKSNDASVFDADLTFRPYATSRREIEQHFSSLKDSGKGYYLWEGESYLGVQQPSRMSFTGTVYILADGRNYSASTDLTSLAAQRDNIFVVGEETGGEYRSYSSGAMYGLVLPNSKIGVKIPTWKTILAIPENPVQRGRGVLPDYPVTPSLDDFISGRDAVLEFTYALIRDRK